MPGGRRELRGHQGERHRPRAGGRQLDRQREPTDGTADLLGSAQVGLARRVGDVAGQRALDEHPQRRRLLFVGPVPADRQRSQPHDSFSGHAELTQAGGQHPRLGVALEQRQHHVGGAAHLLEVVQQQQHRHPGERPPQRLGGSLAEGVGGAEGGHDGVRHHLTLAHRAERHDEPVTETRRVEGRERQLGLADAGRAGEHHRPHPRVGDEREHRLQLVGPADERPGHRQQPGRSGPAGSGQGDRTGGTSAARCETPAVPVDGRRRWTRPVFRVVVVTPGCVALRGRVVGEPDPTTQVRAGGIARCDYAAAAPDRRTGGLLPPAGEPPSVRSDGGPSDLPRHSGAGR